MMMLACAVVMFNHWLTKLERLGMGIMGGTGLMTVPVIYYTALHQETPYDGWAASLFTLGAITFFAGWMHRKWRHDVNNRAQIQIAREHFRNKAE